MKSKENLPLKKESMHLARRLTLLIVYGQVIASFCIFSLIRDANAQNQNVAKWGVARQSTTFGHFSASKAIDAITQSGSGQWAQTKKQNDPWWEIDLRQGYDISKITIWNRGNLRNFYIMVSQIPITDESMSADGVRSTRTGFYAEGPHFLGDNSRIDISIPTWIEDRRFRYIRIFILGNSAILSLSEVEIFGVFHPESGVQLPTPEELTASSALSITEIKDWKGKPVKNIWDAFSKLPNDGKSLVERFEIPGTSSHHMFETYAAGIQHVRGLAKVGSNYVLVHNTRSDDKGVLMIISKPDGTSTFFTFGKKSDPGAIQACGTIVVVTIRGDKTYFINLSNPDSPYELPVTIDESGEAAGIVYHPVEKCHYVMLGMANGNDFLYKSNGDLPDQRSCTFTRVPAVRDNFALTRAGGTHLYYDEITKKIYLAGMERLDGYEALHLEELGFDASGKAGMYKRATRKFYSYDGDKNWPGPGFMWGGFMEQAGGKLIIYAAARTLSGGPSANYCEAYRWKFPQDYYVKFFNQGGYTGKYMLTYDLDNAPKSFSIDLMSGQSETYIIPAQAQNIVASAASITGLGWDNNIFKEDFESPPRICFKTYGTTLGPGYSNDCR